MAEPRTITIDSPKLMKLLREKEDMILIGREKSEDIEAVERDMEALDKQIQEIEHTADTEDLQAEAETITADYNAVQKRMSDMKQKMFERAKAVVPPELVSQYEEKEKEKKVLEKARNKIAQDVQKRLDKIIPLAQKLMKPFLQDDFEDYDTIRIEDGKIVATIFSHLEEFKDRFFKRRNSTIAPR